MKIYEEFKAIDISKNFYWFNRPERFKTGNGLEIYTQEKTDFWQKTHYGFRRDDGHCLFTKISGDFSTTSHVEYEPQQKYDQCGLMLRVDAQNWIKVSTEYERAKISRLGSVVTNLSYSDWATRDISASYKEMWYRISRRGNDFFIEHSFDGLQWHQMRISHLHSVKEQVEVGPYACSPIGKNFKCRFLLFRVDENGWFYNDA